MFFLTITDGALAKNQTWFPNFQSLKLVFYDSGSYSIQYDVLCNIFYAK